MFFGSEFVSVLCLPLLALAHNIYQRQAPNYGYGNSTITAPPSGSSTGFPTLGPLATAGALNRQAQDSCCFVIQDTLSADYWADYYTSTWYGLRMVTSIVTSVTQYIDTIITNYETTTTVKNASYTTEYQVGVDNVGAYNQAGGTPYSTAFMLNGTAASTYGTVVTSPAGFFVIPSVKIIHVPAVTQPNGQLACTTTSTYRLSCPSYASSHTYSTLAATAVFTGQNLAVQNYYSGQQGPSVVTDLATYGGSGSTSVKTMKQTLSHSASNTTAYPSTTVIMFSEPYLYFPPNAATEATTPPDVAISPYPVSTSSVSASTTPTPTITLTEDITSTVYITDSSATSSSTSSVDLAAGIDTDNRDYGFPPTNIIHWILQNPAYSTQYPDIATCLPGGPSINPGVGCESVAADSAVVVPDLTTGTAVTVKGAGCFHPGNCPQAATATPAAGATAVAISAVPEVQPENSASPGANPPATIPTTATAASESNVLSGIAPIPEVQSSPSPKPSPNNQLAASPNASPNNQPAASPKPSPDNQPAPSPKPSPNNQPAAQGSPQAGNTASEAGPVEATPASQPEGSPAAQPQGSPAETGSSPTAANISPAPKAQTPPATSPPAIIIGSSIVTADSSSNFVVGSQTIAPGGSPVVIASSTFSLEPSASAIVVNGATSVIQSPSLPESPPNLGSIIAGAFTGHTGNTGSPSPVVSANSASNFVIGSQSLAPGPSAVVALGSTFSLTPSAPAVVVSASAYVINGLTLAPGSAPITVEGTTYLLPPSSSAIVINGKTSSIPPAQPSGSSAKTPILTLGSSPITANSASAYVVSGQTLAPGSSPITVEGSTYSLAPSASAIVVNGKTSSLSPAVALPPVLIIGSSTITANSASAYIISGQILATGSTPITVQGTVYSLAPSASAIVVNGQTSSLESSSTSESQAAPVFSIGSQLVTASPASASALVFGSQTLTPGGPAITINNTPVSLPVSGSTIVVGDSTETLSGTAPVVTLGSSTITGSAQSEFIVGGQTLVPGASPITVSGVKVSLEASATAVVVGGTTERFSAPSKTGSATAAAFTGGVERMRGVRRGSWEEMLGIGVGVVGLFAF